jgi:phosphoserine phosphatase
LTTRDHTYGAIDAEDIERILDVTRKLAQPHDLHQLLDYVVEAGTSVLSAEKGALWLLDNDRNKLIMRAEGLVSPLRADPGEGLVGECLAERRIINLDDASGDPRFLGIIDRALGFNTRSILVVPLLGWDGEPVGVLQLMNQVSGRFSRHDEHMATALAAQCAVAVQRARLHESLLLKERLDEEVALAREIQMSTLPEKMPDVPGYDLHGQFLPTDHTGGDLFDLVMLGQRLFILMGDATGHGFGPALSATQMQAMLRVAFRCGADLDEAYRHVNNQLSEDLPNDRFITAFMGFLDPATHEVTYHSGGQGPILHFSAAQKQCHWHHPTTFPVGVMDIEQAEPAARLRLEPGDVLALLSDGIYEYENRQGVPFGQSRVAEILRYDHHRSAAVLAERILEATKAHGRGVAQHDDITLVIVKRDGGEA